MRLLLVGSPNPVAEFATTVQAYAFIPVQINPFLGHDLYGDSRFRDRSERNHFEKRGAQENSDIGYIALKDGWRSRFYWALHLASDSDMVAI